MAEQRTSSQPRSSREQGFTLVEVLVAFVICALLLGAFLKVLSSGVTNVRVSQDYDTALLLAQSKLAGVGISSALRIGETEGRFDDRFRWRLNIRPYEEEFARFEAAAFQPVQLILTVLWGRVAEERSVALTTLTLTGKE